MNIRCLPNGWATDVFFNYNPDMDKDIKNLLTAETQQLLKLRAIVKKSIDDETLIIENLLHPPIEILTGGQKLSDKVARFGGSWAFIISFFLILVVWILFNTLTPKNDNFDPYPFILMNLILSCIAALQAPIIMMSQNRQEEKDRTRAENDYLINLKSELEIRALHQKIDLLLEEQIKVLFDSQAKQMEILKNIELKIK
jgi:uncharacterized membrane protein